MTAAGRASGPRCSSSRTPGWACSCRPTAPAASTPSPGCSRPLRPLPAGLPAAGAPTSGSPATGGTATSTPGRGAAPVEGFYQPARHNTSTIEKLLTLTTSLRLSVRPDGRLSFAGSTWTPVGAGLYRQDGGVRRLVSVTGSDGARYAVTDGPAYQRVPWPQTIPVTLAVLAAFAVLAVSAVLGLPVAAGVRRLRRRPPAPARGWRAARLLAALAAGTGLLFVVLLALVLVGGTSILFGMPGHVRALLLLPPLAAGLAAASTVVTARAWRQAGPDGDRPGSAARAHQLALLVALAGLCWFCGQWNLFGWRF